MVRSASPWPWLDHWLSGLLRTTIALFTLAFALAPCLKHLTLLYTVTRRIIMQKARSHAVPSTNPPASAKFFVRLPHAFACFGRFHGHSAPTACKYMVSGSISLPSTGFFSFFSRPTAFTIGRLGILSLRRWASPIHAGFHVSGATWVVVGKSLDFRLRDSHPLWWPFSIGLLLITAFLTSPVFSNTR